MKKILGSIGGVFVAIWRWIKNTAWVQPLLIVGAIFGVIFSIPAISNGIQNMINNNNSSDSFYRSFQLSMDGGKNSRADKLFNNYYKNLNLPYDQIPQDEQKYFLMFTKSGDVASKDLKAGFEILRDNWNSKFTPVTANEKFKLYTIFTDEVTKETQKNKSAFAQLLDRHGGFFEDSYSVGINSNYYINGKITKTDLESLATPDPDNFKVPTIMLIDFTKGVEPNKKGLTQVFFNADGDDGWQKAPVLYNCWNSKGDFGPTK